MFTGIGASTRMADGHFRLTWLNPPPPSHRLSHPTAGHLPAFPGSPAKRQVRLYPSSCTIISSTNPGGSASRIAQNVLLQHPSPTDLVAAPPPVLPLLVTVPCSGLTPESALAGLSQPACNTLPPNTCEASILALPNTSCVTLGKAIILSVPPFLHL